MNNGNDGEIRVIVDLTSEESQAWDKFVSKAENSSIYHLYSWRYLIHKVFGHSSYYMCAKNAADKIVAVLPLIHMKSRVFGNFLISMPYFNYGGCLSGEIDASQKLHERAVEIAKTLSASHIEFRDIESNPFPGLALRKDKVSMRLQLPSDSDQLWSGFSSKLRSQIKRPQKENPEVRCGGEELIDDFYKVFSRNMRDLGTPVYSQKLFRSIFELFKGHCHIVVVYFNERPVATGFLIGYEGMLEIPWASSLKEYNKFSFNMLMYWEALKLGIEKSYEIFDFGRSSIESGTYRFKKQWGALPVELNWHYWLRDGDKVPMLNHSNPKYRMAISAWKKLPLTLANLIGPMLVKNLP